MSMTYPLPRQTRESTLTASAGQTMFGPFDFILFDPLDLEVEAKTLASSFAEIDPSLYIVAPAAPATAFPALFTVTLLTPRSAGDTVWIKGSRLGSRTTDVTRAGALQSQALETELDRHVVTQQELRRDVDRLSTSLLLPVNAEQILIDAGAARDVAQAGAAAAILAAAALENQVHQYDTRAQAVAATIPQGVTLVRLLGRNVAGDLGGGLYRKLGAAPGVTRSWHFQNAISSAYWQLVEREVNPRMFNATGDGAANDYAALQDAIDYMSAINGGGDVYGVANDVYRVNIGASTPERGLILKQRVNLLGRGTASIRFYQTNDVYGIRPLGNNKIIGWKELALAGSASLGSAQSIYHTVVSMGAAYGEQGTVANPDVYTRVKNIEIAFNTFTSVRPFGSIVQGTGGMSNIYIHRNIFPDNATVAIAIGFDWSFLGTLSVSNLNQAKTDYNAGTMFSIHPNNLRIESNVIGRLTMTGGVDPIRGTGIRISGGYNYSIRNNYVEEVGYAGIFITGGDCSFEFAPNEERRVACRNIVVEGNMVRECNQWYGIYCESYPDNVFDAVEAATYSPLFVHDGYDVNTRIVGNHVRATIGVNSQADGIRYSFARGGLIADNYVSGFQNGVSVNRGAKDVRVRNNQITQSDNSGVQISSSLTPYPERIVAEDNWVKRVGWVTANAGGIQLGNCIRPQVSRNHLGQPGEDQMSVGINLTTGATLATICGNIVEAIKSGGTAYVLTSSTSAYGALQLFENNQYEGADTLLSGLNIIPIGTKPLGNTRARFFVATRAALSSGITPPAGAWLTGDTIYYIDPNASDYIGTVCTSGGAQGTWKRFGATAA